MGSSLKLLWLRIKKERENVRHYLYLCMKYLLFPLVLVGFWQYAFTKDACPIVSAPIGQFQGSILYNSYGKPIFSYRGIRYARAPINELRFKDPVPVKKHSGVYNATEDGAVCPQDSKTMKDPMSEDCLFLNVYTTKLPDGKTNPKRPVIVYLHYGGFYESTGMSTAAGPQYLLNQDIVLVSFNYRLGVLGFLSTGDKEAPGNYGLKDQVIALRWVKANIAAFGGDPNSVTLFGYSAGAMSVTLHLVSPMSKGLFHRGIVGSSSQLGNIPFGTNQLFFVKRQAKAVGCPVDPIPMMVQCLRQTSAKKIGDSLDGMLEIKDFPALIWKAVVEPDFGQERFLTDNPVKLIREGKFHDVPILSGNTKDEMSYLAPLLLSNEDLRKKFNDDWDTYAPIVFLYERYTNRSKAISATLKSYYLDNKKLDNSSQTELAKIFYDGDSGYAVDRGAELMAQYSNKSFYYYLFSYQGQYSFYYTPESNNTKPYGVVHCDDLIYLFHNPSISPLFGIHDTEFKMVDKLTTLWTNFAKYGKPIVKTCGKLDYVDWPVYDLKTKKYMDIDETLTVKAKLHEKRNDLWDQFYPSSADVVEDITY